MLDHRRGRKSNRTLVSAVQSWQGGCSLIEDMGSTLFEKFRVSDKDALRRYGAMLICLALFYFAAGGSFLHQHSSRQDPVCHVCQSLHAPALLASTGTAVATPEIAGWHDARPIQTTALNEVSLHHAGRAPPSA